ncbi:hypothetical protein RhiirB3_439245 [Rhizophagus irregularis]|nr:hypothetical protein RhiirB3_439245 [Rhizophagus irregularis]
MRNSKLRLENSRFYDVNSLMDQPLPTHFISSVKGLKSFKIIQTAQAELSWNQYEPPTQQTRSHSNNTNKNQQTSGSQSTNKNQQNSKNSKKKLQEKSSKKPKKQKKDKSHKASRSKVLVEIIDILRKLI